ncbi:MAG: 23S rRNA (pseudouridine(1915)-N(3))-methyltransferase RlmH [Bacteroidales bacterium]|nr:23S rRNA (pseudouridine(1915)-N(3))-methyltransferase RlmH [Bacteroidales bacterium]
MKIHVVFTGRTTGKLFQEAIADYQSRLSHYVPFSIEEIPDLKNVKSLSEEQQKEREADLLFERMQAGDVLVLLDEKGKEFTSREFSLYLEQKMQTVSRRLVFLIGGPYGFSPRVYEAAQGKISLSKMTFSHQMVRLFLVEQIYRACTIMRGEPYHHD